MQVIQVTGLHRHDRLVEGEPVGDPIAKQTEADVGITRIGFDNCPVFPAAALLHAQRHIEVIEIDKRGDALRQQLVDHRVIEGHRLRVHLAVAVRDQPRPRNRGSEGIVAQRFEQPDIGTEMVVKGRGLGRPHPIVKALGRNLVPIIEDIAALAVPRCRTFRLRRGGGAAPPEPVGKLIFHTRVPRGAAAPPRSTVRISAPWRCLLRFPSPRRSGSAPCWRSPRTADKSRWRPPG